MGSADWTAFGHDHELGLDEVQGLRRDTEKAWGWVRSPTGSEFFQGGNDDLIALRFLTGHDYEPVTRALWRRLCEDAPLVADVGTHSGVFSLDAYRAGAKKVLCVEPNPINYARLVLNLRHAGYGCDYLVFGALGDENSVCPLSVTNLVFCNAAGAVNGPGRLTIPTSVFRMDAVVPEAAWPGLKAVKIDAENLTGAVLRGMGRILEHRPDLIIECIEPGLAEILRPYGYRFWRIWETGKIEEVDDLAPYNPDGNYNGTHEDCRNRFASVRALP